MDSNAVAIAVVVMGGLVLSVIAWQLLAVARTAVARGHATDVDERLEALEALHRDDADASTS